MLKILYKGNFAETGPFSEVDFTNVMTHGYVTRPEDFDIKMGSDVCLGESTIVNDVKIRDISVYPLISNVNVTHVSIHPEFNPEKYPKGKTTVAIHGPEPIVERIYEKILDIIKNENYNGD
jgi:hypothetical protein